MFGFHRSRDLRFQISRFKDFKIHSRNSHNKLRRILRLGGANLRFHRSDFVGAKHELLFLSGFMTFFGIIDSAKLGKKLCNFQKYIKNSLSLEKVDPLKSQKRSLEIEP